MDAQKQQVLEKLQAANNILVTVSRNPSVDQLSACIALTLLLNKLEKHATAVFSGKVPSTIEFLKPDDTIEKNTDSLRDFIIALDKSKADKLRYKVEDKVVKIFITPYRTSLSADDLQFSQGDFNVDVVLALGVHQQSDLDDAITAHGRILHDAVVMCINNTPNGELGSINWVGTEASSLSELAASLAKEFEGNLLDSQISTALLTGIVAETDRFRNDKTTATTMSLSADLMRAGANQQLVADELEHQLNVQGADQSAQTDTNNAADAPKEDTSADTPASDDGTLEINHVKAPDEQSAPEDQAPASDESPTLPEPQFQVEDQPEPQPENQPEPQAQESRSIITEAPTLGGRLTANTTPDDDRLDAAVNPLNETNTAGQTILDRDKADQPFVSDRKAFDPLTAMNLPAPTANTDAQPTSSPEPVPTPAPAPAPQPFAPAPQPSFAPPQPAAPTPAPAPQPSQAPQPAPFTPPAPQPQPQPAFTPPAPAPRPQESLTEQEDAPNGAEGDSTKQAQTAEEIEEAREAVMRALNQQTDGNLPPIEALNAQPVDLGKPVDAPGSPVQTAPTPPEPPQPAAPAGPVQLNQPEAAPFANSPADKPLDMPLPPSITLPPVQTTPPTNAPTNTPNSPPPVPPPITPNFGK